MIKTQPPTQKHAIATCCAFIFALGAFTVLICGCERRESITLHESVPITRKIDGDATSANAEPKFRMITAIAERPEATWFFKLSGPIEDMEIAQKDWVEFMDSVSFDQPEPEWKLPEGWSSKGFQDRPMPGGAPMRIANIKTVDDEVTVSVTSLNAGQELLLNVNRWRGQLGLGPTTPLQLATQISEHKNGSLVFKVFDAKGPQLTTRMGGAPFAGGGMGGRPRSPHAGMGQGSAKKNSLPTNPKTKRLFDYEHPEGWEAGETSTMTIGRWNKKDGDANIDMKLLTMNPTDESWELNVEAWARQVKMEPPPIDEVTKPVDIDGTPARAVQLTGPVNEETKRALAVRAVMFKDPADNGYVLLLSGSESAVDANADAFQSLLDSIKFKETDE